MRAATLDMLMMAPWLRRLISLRASRVQKKVPFRCTAIMRCQDSSVISWVMSQWVWMPWPLIISAIRASARSRSLSRFVVEVPAMPALLTSTSRVPNSRSIWANIALTCALSATSAWMAQPPEPMAATVSRAASSRTSFAMTRAPSSAKSCAMARPMPEPAPVTRATLSLSFMRSLPMAASAIQPGRRERSSGRFRAGGSVPAHMSLHVLDHASLHLDAHFVGNDVPALYSRKPADQTTGHGLRAPPSVNQRTMILIIQPLLLLDLRTTEGEDLFDGRDARLDAFQHFPAQEDTSMA